MHADPEAHGSEEVRRVCGADEAAGYRRYVDFVSELYRAEMRTFIDRNIDTPLDLLRPDLLTLLRRRGSPGWRPMVAQYLKDERLQRVFSFQSLYAGLSPYDALAIYAVIAYMDSVAGVFSARGGDQRGALGDGGGGRGARGRVPLQHRRDERGALRRAGHRRHHRRRRAGCRATPSCSTPTCRWPTATCWA